MQFLNSEKEKRQLRGEGLRAIKGSKGSKAAKGSKGSKGY
jgi:hypothetical protein